MFFQGTLQEGISTALQQSKPVVCFVTDDGDESQQWETEFLAEDTVKSPLETHSVALKLQAGSEEAGHLEALFPVPRKPTVIVIQNGQLREYIAASTAKEEFIRRLSVALGGPSTQASSEPALEPTLQSNVSNQAPAPQPTVEEDNVDGDDDLYGDVAPSQLQVASTSSSQHAPAPTIPSTEDQSSQTQAEEAAHLEAEREAKEAAAKEAAAKEAAAREAKVKEAAAKEAAAREAKVKEAAAKAAAAKAAAAKAAAAKAEATGDGNGDGTNSNAAETNYANMLRKRKQDERAERQRILQRIEDDKRERREREAQERKARQLLAAAAAEGDEQAEASSSADPQQPAVPLTTRVGAQPARDSPHCSLQIRQLDGSTLRHRFASTATLARDVRPWVDENRTDETAARQPYMFRVLLTPLPNRAIAPAEETEPLRALGLAPSSTLILVPQPRVAGVIERSGNVFVRVWAGIYAFLAMVLGLPGILLGGGGGGGGGGSDGAPRERAGGWQEQEELGGDEEIPMDNLDGQSAVRRRTQGQRIRRFENPDDLRRDQQLYNGNSLNFEPRRDDENQDQ